MEMIGFDFSRLEDYSTQDPEQSDLNEICITNGINIKKLPTEAPKVTSLELFFNGFVDLHCLKKFAKIEKLVLFGSDLSALFRVDFGCCLTELWLCETKLKRIPDLTACPLIERLFLYGNRLNKVENLSHLRNLQVLDLAENALEDLTGLANLAELEELNLAANKLRVIGPEIEKLKKLRKLDLSGNPIDSLVKLNPLRNLCLSHLNMAQNIYPLSPICRLQNYQLQICYTLPSLSTLDGEDVCKRIAAEAIKVIKCKIVYYNMKNAILRRSIPEYLAAIRNLSKTRLNVPMESIKDLKAELFRVEKIRHRNRDSEMEKAAITHKIDLLETRLNYWKEFHRKLYREERKAFQAIRFNFRLSQLMIRLELQSGGNIRFEEVDKEEVTDEMHEDIENDNIWSDITNLVGKNCAQNRRTVLGIEELQINRITRICHRPKRMRFDEEMDEIFYHTNYILQQSYVFLQADPTKPEETISFIERGTRQTTSNNILCTSPFDADTRFNKNYNSSYPPASCHLIICRVYLGRSVPVKGDQWDAKSYHHAESIYEETNNGRKYSLSSDHYLLPEYVVEMEYIPKPRSFPPLIFHDCLDNQRHQFTPRPTQAQEDKDYEVKNCHPRTAPLDVSEIITGEISHLTVLALVGLDLDHIPNLIMFPHLKELDVSCNRLTTVERVIRCSRQIETFNCSHNNIITFELPEFKQLKTLNISWNNLTRLHQLIGLLSAKTSALADLDIRANFFKEDNDEKYSKISVFDHCAAKIQSLKMCNGQPISDEKRRKLQTQLLLNKKIVADRGRTGNANGCIRLCNSSQYLHATRRVDDVLKITSICLDDMGLSGIEELKFLTSLRYVSLQSNHISDLSPLKSCTKLIELCAADNELVRVASVINSFPSLAFLDLSQNHISELALDKGLIYLTSLNLSGNRISQVGSYIKLKRLKELYLANNCISDCNELIHLKNCPALEILDITSNPFREKLDNAPKLFIMYHFNNLRALDGQPVETKDVQRARDIFGGRLTNDFLVEKFGYQDGFARVNLDTIDELDLRDCDIRSVHLEPEQLSNLTSLNIMGNLLTNFSGLVILKELKTLCLSNNNIESIFPLTKNQRAQLNRSQYSQYQKKDSTEKRITQKVSDDCDLLPKLEVLHLGANKVKEMSLLQLRRFPLLKSLFLEGNDISKIDGLEGCSNLRHLVLDRNRIKQIDPSSFQGQWRLEELHLDNNRLTYMSNIRPLVNLKRLYLGMNRIQEVDEIVKLRPLTSLTEVSMIGNGLARRMLHRPMLIWHVPSIENIDGMKVSIEERRNAEAYFLDQGHEPVFHMFDTYANGYPRAADHQNGTNTPSLSTVLSHGYKAYPTQPPIKGTVARLQNQKSPSSNSPVPTDNN